MSLKNLAKTVFRAAQLVAQRVRVRPNNLISIVKPARANVTRVVQQASRLPLSRNVFVRAFQTVMRNNRLWVRPFAALAHHRDIAARYQPYQLGLHPRLRANKKNVGVIERIKDLFGSNVRYNQGLASTSTPNNLDGYEIGNHIACGCNAAVYELRTREYADQIRHFEAYQLSEPLKMYPLAVKIMFNYQFDQPEKHLWQEMGPEMIPLQRLPRDALQGRMTNFKPLSKSHPNVIKLHTAFVDVMPTLPDAEDLYPDALPSAGYYESIISEPKTLFIVMKRYRMTLRDYVISHKRNYWAGRVMFGQLMEAIVFLYEHKIAHRDMKSDNVLLDFDDDDEVPHLVLSDFGSALASGSWNIKYEKESEDLGGNLPLRAPEIRRLKHGTNVVANFEMADTWAAGTLAYEIFTRYNPFYSRLSSETYEDADLPLLPRRLHYAVKQAIYGMIKVDPTERPDPRIAANVVSISLFRFGQDVRSFLEECGLTMGWNAKELKASFSKTLKKLGENLDKKLEVVTELYAAETILSKLINPAVISNAELQLRATFLSRLNRDQVWKALEYFYDEDTYQRQNSNGSVSTDSSTPTFLSF